MTVRLLVVPYRDVMPRNRAIEIVRIICEHNGWNDTNAVIKDRLGAIVVEDKCKKPTSSET